MATHSVNKPLKINKRPMDDDSDEENIISSIPTIACPEDLTKDNKICLINGYTRQQYKQDISSDIIKLFYNYYELSIYWSIDNELLSEMSGAKNYQKFTSKRYQYTFNNN